MKKLFLLIALLTLISCSKSEPTLICGEEPKGIYAKQEYYDCITRNLNRM